MTVVDRIVDAASDTFGVQLELANPDNAIPGGVCCDIAIERWGLLSAVIAPMWQRGSYATGQTASSSRR